jgi:hypothetical protein
MHAHKEARNSATSRIFCFYMKYPKEKINKERIGIGLSVGTALLCLLLFFFTSGVKQESPPAISIPDKITSEVSTTPTQKNNSLNKIPASPPIKAGVETTLIVDQAKITTNIVTGTTVYDFMDRLQKEKKITFTEKTYTGLGKLIESINGVRSDGNNYWIYYVNGQKAKVGVSNYTIKPGDVVSWKYEKDINN